MFKKKIPFIHPDDQRLKKVEMSVKSITRNFKLTDLLLAMALALEGGIDGFDGVIPS